MRSCRGFLQTTTTARLLAVFQVLAAAAVIPGPAAQAQENAGRAKALSAMNDSYRPSSNPAVFPPRDVPCTCPPAPRHAPPHPRLRQVRWFLAALLALAVLPGPPPAFAKDRVEQVTGVSLTLGEQAGQVDVAWDRPGGEVTDYRILWRRADSDLNWRDQPDAGDAFPTARSYTISGLVPGQEYVVRVRGRGNGVSGPWSDHAYITLLEPPPVSDPPGY